MPPRKKSISGPSDAAVVAKRVAPSTPASRSSLPDSLRFPLVVLLNLSLSGLLYSVSSELITGDLAEVSRRHDEWTEIVALLGVKSVELGISWFGGYDSESRILSQRPTTF